MASKLTVLGIALLIFSAFVLGVSYLGIPIPIPPYLKAAALLLPFPGAALIMISWARGAKGVNWKWRLLSVPGIALLMFSALMFGVVLFGPSLPSDHYMRDRALIGASSLALGVALVAIALLKGRSAGKIKMSEKLL